MSDKYTQIARDKLEERNSRFKSEWLLSLNEFPSRKLRDVTCWISESGILTDKELDITDSNVATILSNIKSRKWKAREVASAFCHRAYLAQQLTNCLSEVFFDEALEEAEALDKYYDETGTTRGPLHGLPLSLKDNFIVKGQASTVGIVNFCSKPTESVDESALVTLLRDMGAVLYVKTNVPVAMMMAETSNHIYGTTLNPLNRDLTCGGSSGGEAALIALRGSPLGIGSDIGGSIRIPSAFNNVYGLRPSFGRFPTYGTRSGLPGLESVNSVNGPMSSDVESLEIYCKSLISHEPWNYDAKVVQLPWKEITLPKTLKFGILIDDGYVHPTPPIKRGMNIIIDRLKARGHQIIDWKSTDHLRLSKLITSFFLSDGGSHVMAQLKATGEPLFPAMEGYGSAPDMSVSDLWDLQAERTVLINNYLKRWNATAESNEDGAVMDAIIMPVAPHAGCQHGKFRNYVGYTSPFNALDYSVGVLPVTRADKCLDSVEDEFVSYNEIDELVHKEYDPEIIHGGGVSVQVVCRRFEEEKVIAILKHLSSLLSS